MVSLAVIIQHRTSLFKPNNTYLQNYWWINLDELKSKTTGKNLQMEGVLVVAYSKQYVVAKNDI